VEAEAVVRAAVAQSLAATIPSAIAIQAAQGLAARMKTVILYVSVCQTTKRVSLAVNSVLINGLVLECISPLAHL